MPGRHRKPPQRRTPGRHRRQRQRARWATPVVVGALALGLGGAGVAAAFSGGGSPAARAPLTAAPAGSGVPTPAATPTAATTAATPATAAERRGSPVAHIGFALAVTGRVAWVEVGVPGRPPIYEGMLRHGRTLRTAARPLRVVVGDAGAVRLVLHGRVHAPLGRPGEVLVFTVAR